MKLNSLSNFYKMPSVFYGLGISLFLCRHFLCEEETGHPEIKITNMQYAEKLPRVD
jgi:hypothetical protein